MYSSNTTRGRAQDSLLSVILEVLNLAAMYGMDDMLLTMAAVFCD